MSISSLAMTAKKVIDAAWENGPSYDLASQAAFALESAQLLQSPETAAELEVLRARVGELLAERHTTNEALSEAAEALRENRSRIAELERPAVERHRREVRESYRWLAGHAREDRDFEGEAVVLQQLREREAVWAREDELAKEFATDPLAVKPWVPGPSAEGSADKLTRLFAPTQALREEITEEPALVVFRASHDSIVMGHYTSREAAQAHCEANVQQEEPPGSIGHLSWSTDDIGADAAYELHITPAATGELIHGTGYMVTPLEVAAAYDEEADE